MLKKTMKKKVFIMGLAISVGFNTVASIVSAESIRVIGKKESEADKSANADAILDLAVKGTDGKFNKADLDRVIDQIKAFNPDQLGKLVSNLSNRASNLKTEINQINDEINKLNDMKVKISDQLLEETERDKSESQHLKNKMELMIQLSNQISAYEKRLISIQGEMDALATLGKSLPNMTNVAGKTLLTGVITGIADEGYIHYRGKSMSRGSKIALRTIIPAVTMVALLIIIKEEIAEANDSTQRDRIEGELAAKNKEKEEWLVAKNNLIEHLNIVTNDSVDLEKEIEAANLEKFNQIMSEHDSQIVALKDQLTYLNKLAARLKETFSSLIEVIKEIQVIKTLTD